MGMIRNNHLERQMKFYIAGLEFYGPKKPSTDVNAIAVSDEAGGTVEGITLHDDAVTSFDA